MKVKEILEELKKLYGSTEAEDRLRMEQLEKELATIPMTEEEQEYARKWWLQGTEEVRSEMQELRQRIDEDAYKLLPVSYIANKYFNKSAAWLYQRINGTPVRGKIYTLNEEDRKTFNRAVQEIAQKIGSVSV